MSLAVKRWIFTTIFLIAIGTVAFLVILHDASVSSAESFTGNALRAVGLGPASSDAPKLVVAQAGLGPVTTTLMGDTLVASFDAGDAILHQDKAIPVQIENAGTGPLELKFVQVSCFCFRSVKLNGYIMGLRDRGATLLPGEKGLIEIVLKTEPDDVRVEDLPKDGRFAFTFETSGPTKKVRFEANCRLTAPSDSKAVQAQ